LESLRENRVFFLHCHLGVDIFGQRSLAAFSSHGNNDDQKYWRQDIIYFPSKKSFVSNSKDEKSDHRP
jgi:hypothetical protein